MAAPAAAAPVYVAGAALVAGAIYLATPSGQRAASSLGEAVYDGGAAAVDDIASLFSGDDEDTRATPTTTTTTNTTTRGCDGPHGGRIQVQGYDPLIDPRDFNTMIPPVTYAWNEPCTPPLRAMGLAQLSANLLVQTRNIRFESAGLRAMAFAKMSEHIKKSPPPGFYAIHTIGWNHLGRRALGSGRNVPRVDLEVQRGRAFGDY